jgi:ketosteroid isomerase-like protein
MTQETTNTVREQRVHEYYQRVDANDVVGLLDLFADDAVYHRPGYEPLVGRARLARFYDEERVIRDGSHAVSTAIVDGASAAVQGEFKGVLKDGRKVSLRFADFFVFNTNGFFQRRDTFFFAPMV